MLAGARRQNGGREAQGAAVLAGLPYNAALRCDTFAPVILRMTYQKRLSSSCYHSSAIIVMALLPARQPINLEAYVGPSFHEAPSGGLFSSWSSCDLGSHEVRLLAA